MIGGPHEGYELCRSYNLTHPGKFDDTNFIDKLKWAIVAQPRYLGRVYKKDQPNFNIWDNDTVYFTFYKGRGQKNKGDRMVNFYMKVPEMTKEQMNHYLSEMFEEDEPLY